MSLKMKRIRTGQLAKTLYLRLSLSLEILVRGIYVSNAFWIARVIPSPSAASIKRPLAIHQISSGSLTGLPCTKFT